MVEHAEARRAEPADVGSAPATPSRPAPLVAPGPELSEDALARSARQTQLPEFDELAQRRLRHSRVLVIGAGGLGCASVPQLAGAGIGTIGVVDDDVVELSNLHRQTAHATVDLGRPKATSLAETVHAIDPSINVHEHRVKLSSANALDLVAQYDLVIDGSDNYPTRYLTNDAAQLAGVPLVWGAILGHHGQASVAWHAHGPGYRDLFPQPPAPHEVVTCASGGVLPGLCGVIGSILVSETIKLITGIGHPLLGRVLVYDALQMQTRELQYARDPHGKDVTELIDYQRFCDGDDAPPPVTIDELAVRLEQGPVQLLDVRRPDERAEGHLPNDAYFPVTAIDEGERPSDLQRDRPVVVYCAKGPRSARAAAALREAGFNAEYLVGGMEEIGRSKAEWITRS